MLMDIRDYPTLCLNSIEVKEIRFYCWPTVHSRDGSMGPHPALPPKIVKNMIFWRKIVIFHTKYPKIFAPPSAIGKNKIFLRKIVIFHTKYPTNFRASLHNWKKYDFVGVKSWFFTRNTPKFSRLPPLSANFVSSPPHPPLTLNPGSVPAQSK